MSDENIGTITHYFDNIGVAVIALDQQVRVGDSVRVVTDEGGFTQTVESMEIDGEKIETAQPGDDVALKVDQPVKDGDTLFTT